MTTRAAAVLYVRQLERMRAFYEQCLDMAPVDTAPTHCVLESDVWSLTLVMGRAETEGPIESDTPSPRRTETPIKLSFEVPDIEVLRSAVARTGGQLDASDSRWSFRGFAHLDGVDPEGNVIQLRERQAGA